MNNDENESTTDPERDDETPPMPEPQAVSPGDSVPVAARRGFLAGPDQGAFFGSDSG